MMAGAANSDACNRLLHPIDLGEIVGSIGQDLAETFVALAETTKQVILSEVDRDRQQVQQVIAYGEYAAYQLAPPVLKTFYRNLFTTATVTSSEKYGKKAYWILSEAYMWASFCVISYIVGGLFGAMPSLTKALKPVLLSINAFVIAVVLLPLYARMDARTSWRPPHVQRTLVCRVCFLIGLLLAYASDHAHTWSPPVYIVPLWIGLVTGFCAADELLLISNRIVYLLLATLPPLLAHVLTVYVQHKSFWYPYYTTKWIAVCLLSVVDLQLKLGRVRYGRFSENLELVNTALLFVLTQFCCGCDTKFLSDASFLPPRVIFPSRK